MLMNISAHTPVAVNIKDESFFKDLGTRVALARKERNITQVQLAATLGIAQQTLAHYEGGRLRLPASLLPVLAQELQLPVEAPLGQPSTTKAATKRGPAPKLAQHMERISALPKKQQKFVMQMIETVLAQQGR
jgi:transcriptional regulator with XRE-family HTH domain